MEALSLIGDLGLNVVDEKEVARCKEMFTLYDEDKDGKLTYAELLTCVRCCGRNPSVDEFKEMVQVIDTKLVRLSALAPRGIPQCFAPAVSPPISLSLRCVERRPSRFSLSLVPCQQDGALAFDDFMSLYVMQLKDGPNNEAEMLEAFQAFDKAGNGYIMVDDLKHVLTEMGTDRLTPEEADMMLKLADKDGDGVLNYEEIIQVLSQDGA